MGMFDDVIGFEANCQKCGSKLDRFQTKSTGCELNTFTPDAVRIIGGLRATFYDFCMKCNTMNTYTFDPETKQPILSSVEQV